MTSRSKPPANKPPLNAGLHVSRHFTVEGQHPYDGVQWELRTARIAGASSGVVFEQEGVEFPEAWSQQATNVVASKYFRGTLGTLQRERSVRQLIGRVVSTISQWGRQAEVFASDADADIFEAELCWLLLHQRLAFNSPVWFNLGVSGEPPQVSACFINSVSDSLESILDLAKTEGMLFKYGSGAGTNLSPIRSSRELLQGGGTATGPLSFMRGYDAFAGAIKSGGKTRRAAKMIILNADHPDIREFVTAKADEEKKALALIAAGYDGSFGGEAYQSIFFQNANHSVRLDDAFMEALRSDGDHETRSVRSDEPVDRFPARQLMRSIAEAAWACGDPGLQFDTIINAWHTCPRSGRINASNPCSEYMFLDDSACNLASLNLLAFTDEGGGFDIGGFEHAVELAITAQEILVGFASYPTPQIATNSERYRPLGLGYANLGALLMTWGLPYDSASGRAAAAAITGLMGGRAYARSAELAVVRGPFDGFQANADAMRGVIRNHRAALSRVDERRSPHGILDAARAAWDDAVRLGDEHGFRNAQATVLAPTGTIAFMMDCDTTGVEPDIALVKYKHLAGGGTMRLVNRSVQRALERVGYARDQIVEILAWIEENDTIEGAPHLQDAHLPVFDCAFRAAGGTRAISPMGHVRMMAAVQPFLSGAISKTVNLPRDATPERISEIYQKAWELGLKAIAVYRDGCKASQPLNTSRQEGPNAQEPWRPRRRRLPDERKAITHKFTIGGHEGYITVGCYPEGNPGELFIVMAKQGSTISGLMDSFATSVSISLQYGVPLEVLIKKFSHSRFEPSGFTSHPDIPIAASVMDYIFRWLALKFPEAAEVTEFDPSPLSPTLSAPRTEGFVRETDAPPCQDCGALMVRSGSCHKCLNCGSTSGCS